MRLSVSMIVRDEESCLAHCLESVNGADEIVVVDTGSVDRTREIASSFGAQLYDFEWCDDFSKARNFSLSKCTGDFVLVIDADEELESSIVDVRDSIECAQRLNLSAVSFRTISKRGKEEHKSIRCFKRSSEIYWKGAVHNYLTVADAFASDVVIRFGYSESHKRDPDRSLRILTKVLEEDPSAVRETYYLAREYWYRKDYETAVKWYTDYLKRSQFASEMADAWLMLARCLLQIKRGDEARDCCLQAIKINADFREALLFMSELSGPKNRECWKLYASMATNKEVLFVR